MLQQPATVLSKYTILVVLFYGLVDGFQEMQIFLFVFYDAMLYMISVAYRGNSNERVPGELEYNAPHRLLGI